MRKLIFSLLAALSIAWGGCDNNHGCLYSWPINKHTYMVSFQGKFGVTQGFAEEMNIIKSAELTKKHHFKYFFILSHHLQYRKAYTSDGVPEYAYHLAWQISLTNRSNNSPNAVNAQMILDKVDGKGDDD